MSTIFFSTCETFSFSSFKFCNTFLNTMWFLGQKEYQGQREKIFRCGYCPKTFTDPSTYCVRGKSHMVVSNVQKRLQEKQTFRVIYLSILKWTHSPAQNVLKPLQEHLALRIICEFTQGRALLLCWSPKTFAWFRSLNQHVRIHTGKKLMNVPTVAII